MKEDGSDESDPDNEPADRAREQDRSNPDRATLTLAAAGAPAESGALPVVVAAARLEPARSLKHLQKDPIPEGQGGEGDAAGDRRHKQGLLDRRDASYIGPQFREIRALGTYHSRCPIIERWNTTPPKREAILLDRIAGHAGRGYFP